MTSEPDTAPAGLDRSAAVGIGRLLDDVTARYGVRLLWAVESGSRAWGFPSPDSDYDCRFIYLRPISDYIALVSPRDVIELPIVDVFDVNGWDLTKTLKLLLKGNAVVIEWLTSLIIYRGDMAFRDDLLHLASVVVGRDSVRRHYLHLGARQHRTYFSDGSTVPLKKLFYALRPAAALRWLRLHPSEVIVPMHFPTLMRQADVPVDVLAITDELLARKAATRELGSGYAPEPIRRFIEAEIGDCSFARDDGEPLPRPEALREANAFLARYLNVPD